jgi:hypothetical protein
LEPVTPVFFADCIISPSTILVNWCHHAAESRKRTPLIEKGEAFPV